MTSTQAFAGVERLGWAALVLSVWRAASGATTLDLDANLCLVVRGGGAVEVRLGDATRALSLPAGRDWLLTATSGADGAPAIAVVELASGGYLIIRASDGVELTRELLEDAAGLAAIFDALAPPP